MKEITKLQPHRDSAEKEGRAFANQMYRRKKINYREKYSRRKQAKADKQQEKTNDHNGLDGRREQEGHDRTGEMDKLYFKPAA
ncbi:MAG: hypothetical protein U0L49_06865 [Eubacterium sp.]|nr:hypothetical protein [Eubacterium sp.]